MKDAICVPRDGDILAALKTVLNAVQGRARARIIPAEWAYEQIMQTARSHTEFALEMNGGSVSIAYHNKHPWSKPKGTTLWAVVLDDVVWIKAWRGSCGVTKMPRGASVYQVRIDSTLVRISETAADAWIRKRLLHLSLPPRPSVLIDLEPVTDNAAMVMDKYGCRYLVTKYGWWEAYANSKEDAVYELKRRLKIPPDIAEKIVNGTADPVEAETEIAIAAMGR